MRIDDGKNSQKDGRTERHTEPSHFLSACAMPKAAEESHSQESARKLQETIAEVINGQRLS
jgi:hypothetical protein